MLSGVQAFYQEMNFHRFGSWFCRHRRWLTCCMTHLLVCLITLTTLLLRRAFCRLVIYYTPTTSGEELKLLRSSSYIFVRSPLVRSKHSQHLYSSITNNMQRYTMVFITIHARHVSGGSSSPYVLHASPISFFSI